MNSSQPEAADTYSQNGAAGGLEGSLGVAAGNTPGRVNKEEQNPLLRIIRVKMPSCPARVLLLWSSVSRGWGRLQVGHSQNLLGGYLLP